jgi:hypothetical protein
MDPVKPILVDQKVVELWIIAVLLGVASYLGMKWRPWFSWGMVVIGSLATLLMLLELSDPASRVGMQLSLGKGYVIHTFVVSVALGAIPMAAALWARSRRRGVV